MENSITPGAWNTEELSKWRNEISVLKECRKALSGADLSRAYHAQQPHFENYVQSVVKKYGAERVNTVLGYTVRHYDYDGRFDHGVKVWAESQPRAPLPPLRSGNVNTPLRDFHELVADAHPVILNFVCRMRIEAEHQQNKPKKKDRGAER